MRPQTNSYHRLSQAQHLFIEKLSTELGYNPNWYRLRTTEQGAQLIHQLLKRKQRLESPPPTIEQLTLF